MHVVNFDLPNTQYGGIDEYIHRIGKQYFSSSVPRLRADISIGRTARIGNEGLATSFYNTDKNVDIAPELVKILLECSQPIPDFLESVKPADGTLVFNDDTDDEGEEKNSGDPWASWEKGTAPSTAVENEAPKQAADAGDADQEEEPQDSGFNW
jgi:ATP-dependent RNA helicase DDX3X